MMKIQNSDFYFILPESYKSVENQCISYALSNAIALICERAKDVRVLADIGSLSDNILDYLAVELRAQYYSQEMSHAEKAGIVASTLPWYLRAGTKSALESLLRTVYGGGEVSEWDSYEGDPFHFKVRVNSDDNDFDGEDFNARLLAIINGGKNLRSILDSVGLLCDISTQENSAPFIGCAINQNMLNGGANSNFIVVVGSDSLLTAGDDVVDSGTFDNPPTKILDCGIF